MNNTGNTRHSIQERIFGYFLRDAPEYCGGIYACAMRYYVIPQMTSLDMMNAGLVPQSNDNYGVNITCKI